MNGVTTINDTEEIQSQVIMQLIILVVLLDQNSQNEKDEKDLTLMSKYKLLQVKRMPINTFRTGILPTRNVNIDDYYIYHDDFDLSAPRVVQKARPLPRVSTQGRGIKILLPKQLLQTLTRLLAQVKTSNTTESLLSYVRQIFLFIVSSKTNFK